MAESAYVACAENISLLHLLHKIPEPPSANTPPPPLHNETQYALPLATERVLASALAFLSSITDDPNCVTAVCVGEQQPDTALHIRVAINKERQNDRNATLLAICSGFDRTFARLARAGDDAGSCEDDVFREIISMCRTRILRRLGYEKKANSKCRSPLDAALERARESLQHLRNGVHGSSMESCRQKASEMSVPVLQFMSGSAELLKVIRSWKLHRTDNELCAVIERLNDFIAIDKWKAAIDLIPDRLMDPSLRRSLVAMLQKGARYRQAARILHRVAKKHPIARHMEAVAVHLPASAFHRPSSLTSPPASLETTSHRILTNQKTSTARLCQALNTSVAAARATFDAQARKTLAEGKFHAEVQLLQQILDDPTPAPPRVVCASKDACFLCGCLLRAHAKLHTPRCHGRLYPGWRLPATATFHPLQAALNRILEQKIRDGAAALLGKDGRRRRVYPYPCESTCSTAVLSDTTVAADEPQPADSGTTVERTLHSPAATRRAHMSEEAHSSLSSRASTIEDDDDDAQRVVSRIQDDDDSQRVVSRSTAPHAEDWTVRQSYALAQGEVVAASLPANASSKIYTAAPLRVQLEYTRAEWQAVAAGREAQHLQYRIQQLTAREAHALRESSYTAIIDVSLLTGTEERTYKLHELAELYLRAGDCIFKLVLQPTPPA